MMTDYHDRWWLTTIAVELTGIQSLHILTTNNCVMNKHCTDSLYILTTDNCVMNKHCTDSLYILTTDNCVMNKHCTDSLYILTTDNCVMNKHCTDSLYILTTDNCVMNKHCTDSLYILTTNNCVMNKHCAETCGWSMMDYRADALLQFSLSLLQRLLQLCGLKASLTQLCLRFPADRVLFLFLFFM